MPEQWMEHLPEIVGGIVLAGFAWGFRTWSYTLEKTSDKILSKLDALQNAFHEHKLNTEKRVTKIETEVQGMQKYIDRFMANGKKPNDPKN